MTLSTLPTSSEPSVPGMDPVAAKRWASVPGTKSPWLHDEVGQRMAQRLSWIKQTPTHWLDWEPVRGGLQSHAAVAAHYPEARRWLQAAHPALALKALQDSTAKASALSGWWQRLKGRAPQEAEPTTTVDLVWANMALHQSPAPLSLLSQWRDRLRVGGFLMFSCLGPDTLASLRRVYQSQGWPSPAHPLTDMHDWGDMLVQAGFAEPVMDMERITLTYASLDKLLADLRLLGRNLSTGRQPGLRGRRWRAALVAALEAQLDRTPDGRWCLEFEVVYGHAFRAAPRLVAGAATSVPLSDMRHMLAAGRQSTPDRG